MTRAAGSMAYVLWHWPHRDVDVGEYENVVHLFHRELLRRECSGLTSIMSRVVSGLAWLPGDKEVREDWYMIDACATLDAMESQIVTAMSEYHRSIAVRTGGGIGALLTLRSGVPQRDLRNVSWFRRRVDESEGELVDRLDHCVGTGCFALWSRHLAIGPDFGYCLQAMSSRPEGT